MNNKKTVVIVSLVLCLVLAVIGTIAYFRRTVNGNVTGNAGNITLVVNDINSEANETFSIVLKRSEEEAFIVPDDKGSFELNIDATGSTSDVSVNIEISRLNLPANLKFYIDSKHKQEITNYSFVIKKSDDMTMTVPIYWYWNGKISNSDDILYMNKLLTANVNVSATVATKMYNILLAKRSTLDTNVDFKLGASASNGEGLMMVNSTQTNRYPIVYYRGDVADNNVIYADFCWLIVRTTETGGIKIIYNGPVNNDGSCNNYSGVGGETRDFNLENTYINKSRYAFNTNYGSPVYVGYMYNDTIPYLENSALKKSEYKGHLADNSIDDGTGRHVQNLKDSDIKSVIDAWYSANIDGKEAEKILEDTVWCADRSVTSTTFSIDNYTSSNMLAFSPFTRTIEYTEVSSLEASPSLLCSRDVDKFTVNTTNGNGDLTYPIGLITADEILMAGNTVYELKAVITYLSVPSSSYWSLSPRAFNNGNASAIRITNTGELYSIMVSADTPYIRPAISLSNTTSFVSGDGTFKNPYIVK